MLLEGCKSLTVLEVMSELVTENDINVLKYKLRHSGKLKDAKRIKMTGVQK